MKNILTIIICLAVLFQTNQVLGQSGQYDLRFEEVADFATMKYVVDIEIKASNAATSFNLAGQNYRFTFDPLVLENPALVQELTTSGFVTAGGTASFYDPHTLTGSIDSIVSYNCELSGGDGYPVEHTIWVPIGRMQFDIISLGNPNLVWKSDTDFPATAMTERFSNTLYSMIGGTFTNSQTSFAITANNDLVLTPIDTPVSFSATANDDFLNGTMTPPFSFPANGSIVANSNGDITYTPNPGFSGIDSFTYEICSNPPTVLCDMAVVMVLVGEVELAGADQALCLVDGSQVQLSVYSITPGIWSDYSGLTISDETSTQAILSDLQAGDYSLVWTTPALPVNYTDTVHISLDDDCVWPGDTDKSALVNHYDILNVGIGYGVAGAARPGATTTWDGIIVEDWADFTPASNVNYKHLDADGNGMINADDTAVIIQNWGQFYLPSSRPTASTGVPFYFLPTVVQPGASIQVPIVLGTVAEPAISAYGLAFTIEYDEALIEPGSAWIEYSNSWFGTLNNDFIEIQKDFYSEGMIHSGATRIDMLNMGGEGTIGILHLTIKDDVLFAPTGLALNISGSYMANNLQEEEELDPTSIILPITTSVSTEDVDLPMEERAYLKPNPTSGQTTVYVGAGEEMLGVSIYNIQGILLEDINKKDSSINLDFSDYTSGMYIIEVKTRSGNQVLKLLNN